MQIKLLSNRSIILMLRRSFTCSKNLCNKPKNTQNPTSCKPMGDVPGLSQAVVSYGKEPVGPGAAKDKEYKNPEYFCYHEASYYDAEIEMLKYRLPQPSSMNK